MKVGSVLFLVPKMRRNPEHDDESLNSSTNKIPLLKLIDCSLRISVIPLSVATIWLTIKNNQNSSDYGNLEFSNLVGLKWETLPIYIFSVSFFHPCSRGVCRFGSEMVWVVFCRYMVYISFISAFYACVAAISSWIRCLASRAWFFFVSDQVFHFFCLFIFFGFCQNWSDCGIVWW